MREGQGPPDCCLGQTPPGYKGPAGWRRFLWGKGLEAGSGESTGLGMSWPAEGEAGDHTPLSSAVATEGRRACGKNPRGRLFISGGAARGAESLQARGTGAERSGGGGPREGPGRGGRWQEPQARTPGGPLSLSTTVPKFPPPCSPNRRGLLTLPFPLVPWSAPAAPTVG